MIRIAPTDTLWLTHYHIRLLGREAFLLLGLIYAGAALLLVLSRGWDGGIGIGVELSRFMMEPGAALFAVLLGSSVVVSDALLELNIATPAGIRRTTAWRCLLSLILVILISGAYLLGSLTLGVTYLPEQTLGDLLLMWLTPLGCLFMVGLWGSLITRSALLGMVIGMVVLGASLILYAPLASSPWTCLFLVSYTFSGGASAPDWLANRAVLSGITLLLMMWTYFLLRQEERLLHTVR